MAGELYKFMSSDADGIAADYTATQLTIIPHEVIPIRSGYVQRKIKYDDNNSVVNTFGQKAQFLVELRFKLLEPAEAGPVFEFYMDSNKAWGMQNTFEWVSPDLWPVMGYTYIARFWSEEIETLIRNQADFQTLLLWLEGYKEPA